MRYDMTSKVVCLALFLVAVNFLPSKATVVDDDALGQSASPKIVVQDETDVVPTEEIFGTKKGYFHPFVALTELWSDNIYNSRHEVSDWQTILSPGIWIAAPPSSSAILSLNTSNISPGGRFKEINKARSFDRYQAYAMYVADISDYASHSNMDNVKQSAEGFFQINLRGGLSVDFFDKFSDSQDLPGTSNSTVSDEFTSNMAGVIATYDLTEKFKVRADYTNFVLDYDRPVSDWRDRTDNAIGAYIYYIYTEKTSLFMQYEFIDVDYDHFSSTDNQQHYTYVGIEWKPTDKTALTGKVGSAVRDSNRDSGDGTKLSYELTADYKMTGKTTAQLFLSQKINESQYVDLDYSVDRILNLSLTTQFTDKISARLQVGYKNSDFRGGILDRTDDVYSASLVGKLAIREWLRAEAGYQYTDRSTDVDVYDYTTNQIFVRLVAGF